MKMLNKVTGLIAASILMVVGSPAGYAQGSLSFVNSSRTQHGRQKSLKSPKAE